MVLFLDRMCQCGLHAVLWSHIGTLMRFLAAEPRRTEGPLFPSQCPSGTILLALYSMAWDWRVSRAGPMLFYWPKLVYPYYNILLFFPSIGWYCGAGCIGLGWLLGIGNFQNLKIMLLPPPYLFPIIKKINCAIF